MTLPVFAPGSDIVIEERWKGRLWSALPQRVVDSRPEMLITWMPACARSVFMTNRGLPEAEGMTRDQRKHEALLTGVARPLEAEDWLDKVYYFHPGRWSRINLAWDPARDHEFLGWYVNFELPPVATEDGIWGKDLVLDLFVYADGRWDWKDDGEFDRALADGLFAPELRPILEREAELVLAERDRGTGAFDPALLELRPEPEAAAVLPPDYAPDGERWRRSYPVAPIP
ncbi:DUF402 domain-containing protein [Microlunatus speluncae]|uniref:DUF402 domain-containing protein n=1 Tax=Microlunatus speluncae TaxID=2594267 RepID=UPI0012664CAD|nr:DUF402 domain-containing protein [Microlunatus speluncae]